MSLPRCLVADIGGTWARFAVLDPPENGREIADAGVPSLQNTRRFACREHTGLESAIDAYLDSLEDPDIGQAVISIAGPVDADSVRMTNLDWSFSISRVQARYDWNDLLVINDAAAGALATTALPSKERQVLQNGQLDPVAPRLNLIPGTGFGVAAVARVYDAWYPIPGEGGHANLAPSGPEEFEVLRQLAGDLGRVTPDLVLSGPGMLRLYLGLAAVRGEKPLEVSPAELTTVALEGSDPLCGEALDLYCGLLGSFAGDMALTFMARGGIYLSGSLIKRLGCDTLGTHFLKRFLDKGVMSTTMDDMPVLLVNRDHPGLIGCAVLARTTPTLQRNETTG